MGRVVERVARLQGQPGYRDKGGMEDGAGGGKSSPATGIKNRRKMTNLPQKARYGASSGRLLTVQAILTITDRPPKLIPTV